MISVLQCPTQQASAEILQKPEARVTFVYHYNESLTMAGTLDPAFQLRIVSPRVSPVQLDADDEYQTSYCCQNSIGNLSYENNLKYSKAFFDFLEPKLGVPDDRGTMLVECHVTLCLIRDG